MTAVLAHAGIMADSKMSTRGRVLAWAAVLLGVLVLVLAVRRPSGEGTPLDPAGTGPLGAKALVLLLSEGRADVVVSAHPPTADRRTAIVLQDTFDEARTDAITAWVRAGGTLVVADPYSTLALARPFVKPVNGAGGVGELRGGCSAIPALATITTIRAGTSLVFGRAGREPGAVGCFSNGDGDWLVATPLGNGTVIALGGAGPFVNSHLGQADAAGLAMALAAPAPGWPTQVVSDLAPDSAEIDGARPGPGGEGLISGLPRGAKVVGIQLLVIFLGLALWRGRRLGRPVIEDPLVEIPGSELVVAVGHLYQNGKHRRRAAQIMAGEARRSVAERLGLPRSTDARTVADVASARTGVPTEIARAAIAPDDPVDDAALIVIAHAADSLAAGLAEPSSPIQENP